MKELIINDNQLNEWIKSVILKYCPIVDDRFDIVSTYKSPEMDIDVCMNDSESLISFCFGTSTLKTSLYERATVNRLVSLKEIINLIDFLIEDHEVVPFFDLSKSQAWRRENTLELNMKFAIDWSDKSLKGLSVGTINLKVNFGINYKITKDYVITILNRYKPILEKSDYYRKIRENFFLQVKKEYFNMLNKQELIEFISMMDETDIRNLLLEIDNDIFEYYFNGLNKSDVGKEYK